MVSLAPTEEIPTFQHWGLILHQQRYMNLTSYLLMTLTYFGQYSAISAKQSKP